MRTNERLNARRILDEAEATGRLLDFVQADDDALHVSAFRKYVVDLPIKSEKRVRDDKQQQLNFRRLSSKYFF